jgi:hypothetical protein
MSAARAYRVILGNTGIKTTEKCLYHNDNFDLVPGQSGQYRGSPTGIKAASLSASQVESIEFLSAI